MDLTLRYELAMTDVMHGDASHGASGSGSGKRDKSGIPLFPLKEPLLSLERQQTNPAARAAHGKSP